MGRHVLLGLGVLLLAGCGARPLDRPPTIRYGEELCGHCGMLVSEARFAAARVDTSGRKIVFDDLVCLLRFQRARPDPEVRVWVHDADSARWVRATEAAFISETSVVTPMGSGLIAAAPARATQVASQLGGRVMTWGGLLARASVEDVRIMGGVESAPGRE